MRVIKAMEQIKKNEKKNIVQNKLLIFPMKRIFYIGNSSLTN